MPSARRKAATYRSSFIRISLVASGAPKAATSGLRSSVSAPTCQRALQCMVTMFKRMLECTAGALGAIMVPPTAIRIRPEACAHLHDRRNDPEARRQPRRVCRPRHVTGADGVADDGRGAPADALRHSA